MLNDNLPERFQLSVTGVMFETMRYPRLNKRVRLKTTRLAWASIGQPTPRGAILPPFNEAGPRTEHMMRVIRDVFDQMREGTLTSLRNIAERLGERQRS